jgi:hypothetical protein
MYTGIRKKTSVPLNVEKDKTSNWNTIELKLIQKLNLKKLFLFKY